LGIDEEGVMKRRIKSGNEMASWIWIGGGGGWVSRERGCSEETAFMAGFCHVAISTGRNETVAKKKKSDEKSENFC